tara:strand:+ start:299 stop:1066 length:768 start_codon:yes stop_codon:yes gene_type:complete
MKNKLEQFFEDFLKNGFAILDVENPLFLDKIRTQLKKQLKCNDLETLHKSIKYSEINNERIKSYRALNNLDDWESKYFSLASEKLVSLLGPDISIQSKLNLSIQMPNDSSSILDLHTDALSGQSVFEIVLWVPLTRAFDSNAMYIFSREKTNEILDNLLESEKKGMQHLFNEYKKDANFLELKYGQCLIFSPTLFHGNILNNTDITRVSVNCRFKNVFSHEAKNGERRLGSFYRVLTLSPVTKLGLSYRDDLIKF